MNKVKFLIVVSLMLFSGSAFAMKIVSLKPNITEVLFAIGAGQEIVGVTSWCDRPVEAGKIAKVADYVEPNVEKIIALKPDIVISSEENTIKKAVEPLERAGIKMVYFNFRTIAETLNSIKEIGKATGHKNEADRLVKNIEKGLAGVTRNKMPFKTAVVVGRRPMVVAGRGTFLSEMIERAGGVNIIDSKILYPHMNIESLIAKDPDVILDLSMGSENAVKSPKSMVRGQGDDGFWSSFPIAAVRTGRVYMLDISDFRAGPDIAKRVKELGEILNK